MSHQLIIRPEAEQDMVQGRDWYEGRQEGLGSLFTAAIDEVFDRIAQTPEMYVSEYRGVRRVGLAHFPYIVYYRFVKGLVEVIAVQHGSRDARWWRSRLKPS